MTGPVDRSLLTLRRDGGDRGPSLAERIADRLNRLGFASPVHRMRLNGRFPLRLLAVPLDPVPGDAARAARMKGGRLFCDGYGQAMAEADPEDPAAPESWRRWVHSWTWLRDMAAAGPPGKADVARTEALAKRWLHRFHGWDAMAWEPEVTGIRIRRALQHAPLVMPVHDHVHRSAVLNGVARWVRHLDRAVPRMPASLARLEAAAGLYAGTLLLPGREVMAERVERLLAESVDALLPEPGAIRSRSPLDLARIGDIALELAAVRGARMEAGGLPDRMLDRVRRALAALAMGDGVPAAWHGGQPSAAQLGRLGVSGVTAAAHADPSFGLMAAGPVRLVMDCGPPPPFRINPEAHASTLAIVMSDGPRAVLVSCGGAAGADGPRMLPDDLCAGLRSTAGHSTLIIADTNSSRLPDGGPRRLGGVDTVAVERRAVPEGQLIEARHDGWRRRFGCDHLRRLWLAADGTDLRGEDHLLPVRGALAGGRKPLAVAVRFHLGPGVDAVPTDDGRGALLRLAGARGSPSVAWAFRARFNHAPGTLLIEPSLHIDAQGRMHEIGQIVLATAWTPGEGADISWSFRRQG